MSSSMLSTAEKEALKLAKTLRQIMKLEQSSACGETLLENQLVKVASNASVVAAFQNMIEYVPPTSHIIQKVQDVMLALDCTEGDNVGSQLDVEVCVEIVHGAMESVQDVESRVADEKDAESRVADEKAFAVPIVEAIAQEVPRQQRRRTRAGRSGFRRKYSANHI